GLRFVGGEHEGKRAAIVRGVARRRSIGIERVDESGEEIARRVREEIQRIGRDAARGLALPEIRTPAERDVEPGERPARAAPDSHPSLDAAADVGLDATDRAVETHVEITMPSAAEAIERDRGDAVAAELELDQIEVVRTLPSRAWHAATDRRWLLGEEIATQIERVRAEFLSGAPRFRAAPSGFGGLRHAERLRHAEELELAELARSNRLARAAVDVHEA